jgi:hypothetical protein
MQSLRQLLAEDPSRANELILWGERKPCFAHPRHFISDMLFEGTLPKGSEIPLVVPGKQVRVVHGSHSPAYPANADQS